MCLLAVFGLLAPRFLLILCWLLNSRFVLAPFAGSALPGPLILLLGLLLLPTTTLAYCLAHAMFAGATSFGAVLFVLIALVLDLGLIGQGRGTARR
jgi:hypothetical protein